MEISAQTQWLTTIHFSKLRPLGSANYPIYTLHQALSETLGQHFGAKAAAFLAQPAYDAGKGIIDYFSPITGTIVPFSALSEAQRETLLNQVAGLGQQLHNLVAKFREVAEPDLLRLAIALEQAAHIPDNDAIFQVGGQPVLTGWGFVQESDGKYTDIRQPTKSAASSAVLPSIDSGTVQPVSSAPFSRRLLLGLLLVILLLLVVWRIDWPIVEIPTKVDFPAKASPPATAMVPKEKIEIEMDQRLQKHGGKIGEITVTLLWDSTDDVDLELHCPNGKKIHHNKAESCGGWDQDVDITDQLGAVENITLVDRSAALVGEYLVRVSLHTRRNPGNTAILFTLRMIKNGEVQVFTNSLRQKNEYVDVLRFTLVILD